MKRALILFVVLVALVAVIGGFAYFQFVMKPEMIRGMIAGGGQPPVTVTAEEARLETWQPKLPAIGTLVAIRGIEVAPEVGGVVREVHFDSGQDIEAGALLV
ncbi:MAG: efflux RND transporter periplasmic adaptor subunit, partial [Kiloniellales bacterium]